MKGRFAPSPTGHIHLGNVWVALLAYLSTRSQGGDFLIRMEDIDKQRSKRQLGEALLDDLEWLGFDWDQGPRASSDQETYWQSHRYSYYDKILRQWEEEGKIYPCFCNRARIQAIASAPHRGEHRLLYDGHCRNLDSKQRGIMSQDKAPSYRLRLESCQITFNDSWQGAVVTNLVEGADDFVLKRADGMFAYNLAVVLDDLAMGVTEVVRGADLLDATAQQIYLYKLLNQNHPTYCHAPLLVDGQGYRLSKRQASITVADLRTAGYSSRQILGHLVRATGLFKGSGNPSLIDLISLWKSGGLNLDCLSANQITMPKTPL